MSVRRPRVDHVLRRMAAERGLGSLVNVRMLSPHLAVGTLITGCKAFACRRLSGQEHVLVWSTSALPKGQQSLVHNAGYIF